LQPVSGIRRANRPLDARDYRHLESLISKIQWVQRRKDYDLLSR
jgi:hypothetical protein